MSLELDASPTDEELEVSGSPVLVASVPVDCESVAPVPVVDVALASNVVVPVLGGVVLVPVVGSVELLALGSASPAGVVPQAMLVSRAARARRAHAGRVGMPGCIATARRCSPVPRRSGGERAAPRGLGSRVGATHECGPPRSAGW